MYSGSNCRHHGDPPILDKAN